MVFTGTSLLLAGVGGAACSKIANYQDLLLGQIDIYGNWGRVSAMALWKKSIAVSLCWPHFFFKFLFQAVYLEFCVSMVPAGNRWPTATENGGNLRKRLFTKPWAEFRETRRTVQFRGATVRSYHYTWAWRTRTRGGAWNPRGSCMAWRGL